MDRSWQVTGMSDVIVTRSLRFTDEMGATFMGP